MGTLVSAPPVFSKGRSRTTAARLAAMVDGTVSPCRMSFGLMTTARHRVKGTHAGMQLEAYVFDPWLEVWVQNFRLRGPDEVAFALNEPQRTMSLVERVPDFAPAGLPVFRRPWDADETAARAFAGDAGNARDLATLGLGPGESLAVLSHQMIARLRTGDDAQLGARFALIAALFARIGRSPAPAAGPLDPLAVTIGEPGDEPDTPHRFGGAIDGSAECRNCQRPLHQLLSLDTQAPPLDRSLGSLPRLPVAACLNCQTLSSPLVIRRDGARWTIAVQAENRSFDDFPAVLPLRPVHLDAPRGGGGDRGRARHRVGGAPEWIQSDETPDCPACSEPMMFLAQLDTDDRVGVQFGDDGRLYAFVCPRCVTVATLVQST